MNDLDSKIFEISWTNVESGSKAMAINISRMENNPDVIISTQEDIVAASLVCNELAMPLCIAHLNKREYGIIIDCLPKFSRAIRSGEYAQGGLPSIVIVSTLINKDRNVDDLAAYYRKQGHSVTIMCIYACKNAPNPPDYHWTYLVPTVTAIFPWEKL